MNKGELLAKVYPQFFPVHWLSELELGIAHSPFPSRIRIGYVLRLESAYRYVTVDELATHDLSLSALHTAALANLAKLPGATLSIAKVPGGSEGWIAASDDNFTAARILLPSTQQEFCKEFGPEFYVAIACRDDCFCWSPSQSLDRHEKHANEALKTFTDDEYNLTPDILRFREGGFELYRQQIVD